MMATTEILMDISHTLSQSRATAGKLEQGSGEVWDQASQIPHGWHSLKMFEVLWKIVKVLWKSCETSGSHTQMYSADSETPLPCCKRVCVHTATLKTIGHLETRTKYTGKTCVPSWKNLFYHVLSLLGVWVKYVHYIYIYTYTSLYTNTYEDMLIQSYNV